MSSSAPAAWVDVRRLFTRFIVLVVVPVIGLVGFGVLAINNERAAVEQRFKDQYVGQLRSLAEQLAATLDSTASRLHEGTEDETSSLQRFSLVIHAGKIETRPPAGPAIDGALASALADFAAPADGTVAFLPIRGGAARGLYAVARARDGNVHGIAFSEEGLSDSIAHQGARLFPAERARFSLEGPREPALPVSSHLRAMLEAVTSEGDEPGTLSLPLPGALSDWRIVATLSGNDPVRSILVRNRTIYIVTLALFYVLIAVGVVATLRGIWREAHLSRLKTDFVSNLSHELRTPLTSIRMFAETLRLGRATTEEERAACIEFIATESERLSAIAERTLDWARLEAGRRPFVRARIAPAQLVREIVDGFLSHGIVARQVISVDVADDLPEVDVDKAALGQVLLNLLENAVKYSGVNKRIQVRGLARRGTVLIAVEDNGAGIGRRDLRRIFDRFYRADDLLTRKTEGTGLGLSIARHIVRAHGGHLNVRSRPGVGSVFTIVLPVASSARNRRLAESHA